jgi:serine/threonine protein kinase
MSDTPKDAKGIFLAALEIADAAEREAFLERSCGGNEALRRRVQELLRAYGQPDGPLDKLAGALATTELGQPLREQVGSTIGPYKLLEQIGEGGFGLVFVAQQERPLRRKVALKIIKPGMDTREVIARFEAERQALALMDHPNIARVLDAGTTDSGRPYFVMELVRGIPITEYCDQSQLTPRDRLCLFVDVCNAVQHAHQKGIIHRDIKPSNVLVTLHDDRPVVKVIDFGVAKALHQHLTEKTIYTRFAQMIGTPLYMSPEQAQMSGLDIDTRSDVYSLGVLLYELLTGTTPLDKRRLAQAAYDELLKIIREEEPPKPSVRLSQSTESLPSIAALRKTEPAKLTRMFDGDVDWIAMKALEKDRTRRYETANAFGADVLRYLNDEPVEASPPSTAYRLRKFARKHRKPVFALAAIAAVLIVGIAGTTWGLFRATKAEQMARTAENAAVGSERKAVLALGEVAKERDAKQFERDRAERQFAIGLLRPIGFSSERMDPAELHSLVDWSAIKESRLKLRVLEIAFEDPITALRVARRAERVIQACVGLSPTRRARAIALVSAKQREATADPKLRVAACWLAWGLGSPDLPALAESYMYVGKTKFGLDTEFEEFTNDHNVPQQFADRNLDPLIATLEASSDDDVVDASITGLTTLAAGLDRPQATRAVNALLDTLARLSEPGTTVSGLRRFRHRLNSAELTRACDGLIAVIDNTSDATSADDAFEELFRFVPRLQSPEIHRVCDALIRAMGRDDVLPKTIWRVETLAARLEPTDVARVGDALIKTFKTSKVFYARLAATKALNALAQRLDSAQIQADYQVMAASLAKSSQSDAEQRSIAVAGLIELGPRLQPAQIASVWDALIAALETSTDARVASAGAAALRDVDGLAQLASRLEPAQVRRSAELIIAKLVKSSVFDKVLIALAPRLSPDEAARAWDVYNSKLEKRTPESNDSDNDGTAIFTALAPRLERGKVNRIVDALTDIIEHLQFDHWTSASRLSALVTAGRLEPPHARRIIDAAIAAYEKLPNTFTASLLARNFAGLSPQLEAAQVQRLGDAMLASLNTANFEKRSTAALLLSGLAPRLTTSQVTRAVDAFGVLLDKEPSAFSCAVLLGGLKPRLDAALCDRLSTRAAASLLDVKSSSNYTDPTLTSSFSIATAIRSPKSLAKLLSHPGCVDEQRQIVLARFEELVLYEGKPIFLKSVKSLTSDARDEVLRCRFRTLHDAAAWIQQNWPDFDLETNSQARWRDWPVVELETNSQARRRGTD